MPSQRRRDLTDAVRVPNPTQPNPGRWLLRASQRPGLGSCQGLKAFKDVPQEGSRVLNVPLTCFLHGDVQTTLLIKLDEVIPQ